MKQGRNDLSRWAEFGGTLKRPSPPAAMKVVCDACKDTGILPLTDIDNNHYYDCPVCDGVDDD